MISDAYIVTHDISAIYHMDDGTIVLLAPAGLRMSPPDGWDVICSEMAPKGWHTKFRRSESEKPNP